MTAIEHLATKCSSVVCQDIEEKIHNAKQVMSEVGEPMLLHAKELLEIEDGFLGNHDRTENMLTLHRVGRRKTL